MKVVALLILSCIFSYTLTAQVLIKAKAGTSISYLDKIDNVNNWEINRKVRYGLTAGVALESNITQKLKLTAELLYTAKGSKYIYHNTIRYVTPTGIYTAPYLLHKYIFNYLELPLLIKYSFFNNLNVGMGPVIAYLFHAEFIVDGKRRNNLQMGYPKSDFGLSIDIAYSINKIEIGTRYVYGLNEITYSGSDPEFYNSGVKTIGNNKSIQVYLAYRYKRK